MWRVAVGVVVSILVSTAAGQAVPSNVLGGLRWRLIGPFRGGRALAVTGVPGNAETFLFGAVGGGVWKSENAGRTWVPIFDGEPSDSIGAIAVAPSDPNVIYVGTGEADMRSDIQQGDGMYRSSDGGKTWSHIGLEDTRQIGKILVDPKNPDIAFVAALGHQYGPNEERGVFKTTDGGKSWTKTLYKSPDIGAIDLAMDPTDSNVIFASLWSTRRPPWSVYPPSNGPGGGLFKSTDGGATWTQVRGGGFPSTDTAPFVGRIGLAISPADHERIYATIDTNNFSTGGMYRSDDGGSSWKHTDGDRRIWTRGWYFGGITADPKDPNTVYAMNTSAYRSTDGGSTFIPFKGAPGGDDNHTLWVAPDDPARMILGSDQGVVVSVDGGKSWSTWYNQPTGQFYHVITDGRFPYWVYGSQQDSGAMAVPSRTIHTGISELDWRPIDAGGESGTIAPDPLHPGLLFSSSGSKEELSTAWEQTIDPTISHPDTVWRSEWTAPITGSTIDPHVFYVAHQKIFRTSNGGTNWTLISPDLTRSRDTVPGNLDAVTASDTNGLSANGVVYWIAPSPVQAGVIWAGTDDGLVWLTLDEGSHWKNVTPRGLSAWSKIGIIDASHFDVKTAYIAVDRHRLDDNRPYIYKTNDGGAHWSLIVKGIPEGQFVNVVREDPHRPGLLYAGTDWGVFVSFDDGGHWQSLQMNLPPASVRDIVFRNGDVIVGTHGRAIWILDNSTPLREMEALNQTGYWTKGWEAQRVSRLFPPAVAVRFQRAGSFGFGAFDEGTPLPPEEPQGENPRYGAAIDYLMEPGADSVGFTILDGAGKVVRRFSSKDKPGEVDLKSLDIPAYWVHPEEGISAAPGGHRFYWDLQHREGPFVPPGKYTVEMKVGGQVSKADLYVVRDPRVAATDGDLAAQFKLALAIRGEMSVVRAAEARVRAKLKASSAADRVRLERLLGSRGAGTPDENEPAEKDIGSLRYLEEALGRLDGAVESAPAAPTAEDERVFEGLKRWIGGKVG